MTFVPFDSIQACPKCGADDVVRQYHPDGHCYSCPGKTVGRDCCQAEHHQRLCRGCGYKWAEKVKPAEANQ